MDDNEVTTATAPEEKKTDKTASENKTDVVEADNDAVDPDDGKKKKKKSAKEETKDKGNFIYQSTHCSIIKGHFF